MTNDEYIVAGMHEDFCLVRDQSEETVGTCTCRLRNNAHGLWLKRNINGPLSFNEIAEKLIQIGREEIEKLPFEIYYGEKGQNGGGDAGHAIVFDDILIVTPGKSGTGGPGGKGLIRFKGNYVVEQVDIEKYDPKKAADKAYENIQRTQALNQKLRDMGIGLDPIKNMDDDKDLQVSEENIGANIVCVNLDPSLERKSFANTLQMANERIAELKEELDSVWEQRNEFNVKYQEWQEIAQELVYALENIAEPHSETWTHQECITALRHDEHEANYALEQYYKKVPKNGQ